MYFWLKVDHPLTRGWSISNLLIHRIISDPLLTKGANIWIHRIISEGGSMWPSQKGTNLNLPPPHSHLQYDVSSAPHNPERLDKCSLENLGVWRERERDPCTACTSVCVCVWMLQCLCVSVTVFVCECYSVCVWLLLWFGGKDNFRSPFPPTWH